MGEDWVPTGRPLEKKNTVEIKEEITDMESKTIAPI